MSEGQVSEAANMSTDTGLDEMPPADAVQQEAQGMPQDYSEDGQGRSGFPAADEATE